MTTGATVLSPERQKLAVKPTGSDPPATTPTDPRIPVAAILTIYVVLGCTWGFPSQIYCNRGNSICHQVIRRARL